MNDLERRFPLPEPSRVTDQELVAAFFTQWDSGRDCRGVASESEAGHVRIDIRFWQVGRAIPTRQGITVALADWAAFAELVQVVSERLASVTE